VKCSVTHCSVVMCVVQYSAVQSGKLYRIHVTPLPHRPSSQQRGSSINKNMRALPLRQQNQQLEDELVLARRKTELLQEQVTAIREDASQSGMSVCVCVCV
jgi:hypothetical protein